jgi:hypothetical protein
MAVFRILKINAIWDQHFDKCRDFGRSRVGIEILPKNKTIFGASAESIAFIEGLIL